MNNIGANGINISYIPYDIKLVTTTYEKKSTIMDYLASCHGPGLKIDKCQL